MEDKIEQALRELLVSHDVVILPGFGAFIATDIPAMVDAQNNTIYPPRRKVTYDPSEKDDDGLFIGFFARQERIAKDTAHEQVSAFVEEMNYRLHRGTPWVVEDLGKFIFDGLDNINFFPDPDQNFTPQSYGLPGVEMETENVMETPREEKTEAQPRKKRKKGVWVALILLLLLSGGAYGFLFHTHKGKEVHEKLYAFYLEKTGKKDEHKKEQKEAKAEIPAEPAKDTAKAAEPTVASAEKPEPAATEEPTAKKSVYKPRTSIVTFEKPEVKDIVPTDLDRFVRNELANAEPTPQPDKALMAGNNPKAENKPVKKAEAKTEKVTTKTETAKKPEPKKEPVTKSLTGDAGKTTASSTEPVKKTSAVTRSPETIYAKYQVVASEHSMIQNAIEASDKYTRMGYNVAVIRFRDGNFGVCLARSNDRAVAERQLEAIKGQVSGSFKLKEY